VSKKQRGTKNFFIVQKIFGRYEVKSETKYRAGTTKIFGSNFWDTSKFWTSSVGQELSSIHTTRVNGPCPWAVDHGPWTQVSKNKGQKMTCQKMAPVSTGGVHVYDHG